MNILNPFNKQGRENTTFIDRLAVTALYAFMIVLAVYLPFYILKRYNKSTETGKAICVVTLILLLIIGGILHNFIHEG